jgi:hypothetical protein
MSKKPLLRVRVGADGDLISTRELTLKGRFAWAASELHKAGTRGCTPIERPAPRWSHYVWRLRHDWGLDIETITEGHAGPYAGHHARYVLRSSVEILEEAIP